MSRWKEKFDTHPIHKTIEQINEWLAVDLDDLEKGDIEEVRRCRKVLDMLSKSLDALDVEIVPFHQLDALNQQLKNQNIWNQINSFSSNLNVAHVKNANERLDQVLTFLTWLVPYTTAYGQHEKIASLEGTVDQTINGLVQKKKEVEDAYYTLAERVERLDSEKSELEATIEQRRLEVDQQISQWQQQFSEAQEKRSSGYTEWKDKVETEMRSKTAEIVKETTEEVEDMGTSALGFLNKTKEAAEKKHQEIIELFQLASGDSISGGYASSANQERFQTNLWRVLAVGFIFLTALWIFSAYNSAVERNIPMQQQEAIADEEEKTQQQSESQNYTTASPNFDWSAFLLSVSLTGVLLYGAAFSGLQSNRHRENEKQMRWFALQIKALDPYINSLKEDDQKELKKMLSEKFFTGPSESTSKDNVLNEHAVSTLTKAMTDVIKASKG